MSYRVCHQGLQIRIRHALVASEAANGTGRVAAIPPPGQNYHQPRAADLPRRRDEGALVGSESGRTASMDARRLGTPATLIRAGGPRPDKVRGPARRLGTHTQ